MVHIRNSPWKPDGRHQEIPIKCQQQLFLFCDDIYSLAVDTRRGVRASRSRVGLEAAFLDDPESCVHRQSVRRISVPRGAEFAPYRRPTILRRFGVGFADANIFERSRSDNRSVGSKILMIGWSNALSDHGFKGPIDVPMIVPVLINPLFKTRLTSNALNEGLLFLALHEAVMKS
jgi:hypothetical protein